MLRCCSSRGEEVLAISCRTPIADVRDEPVRRHRSLSLVFLPEMARARYGRVVNVSSGAGQLSTMSTYAPAYSMSKAALNAFTRDSGGHLSKPRGAGQRGPIRGGSAPTWAAHRRRDRRRKAQNTIVWLATLPEPMGRPADSSATVARSSGRESASQGVACTSEQLERLVDRDDARVIAKRRQLGLGEDPTDGTGNDFGGDWTMKTLIRSAFVAAVLHQSAAAQQTVAGEWMLTAHGRIRAQHHASVIDRRRRQTFRYGWRPTD